MGIRQTSPARYACIGEGSLDKTKYLADDRLKPCLRILETKYRQFGAHQVLVPKASDGLERQFKQKVSRNQRLGFVNRLLQECGQDFAPGDVKRLLKEYSMHEIVKIGRVLPLQ